MSDNGRAERVCRPEGSMCKVARLASWETNYDPEQIIVPSHKDNALVGAGSGLASRGRRLQAATTILGGTAALFKVGSAGGEAFRAAVAATLGVAITAVEMDDATPPVDVSAAKAAKTALRRRRLLASASTRTTLSSVTIDFTVTMPGAEGKVTKAFLTGLGRNPTFVTLLCAELAKAQLSLEAGACQAPAGSKAAWEKVERPTAAPTPTAHATDEDGMMAALNKSKATASLDLSHKTAGKITDLIAARKAKAAAATAAVAAAAAAAAAAGEKLFNLTNFSSGGNLTNFSSTAEFAGSNLTNASLPLNASSITAIITATTTAPPTTTTTTPKAKRKTCSIVGGIEVGGYTRDNLRDVFGSGPIRRLIAAKAGNGATAELVLLEKFLPSKTNTETVVVEFRVMSAAQVREGGGVRGWWGTGVRGHGGKGDIGVVGGGKRIGVRGDRREGRRGNAGVSVEGNNIGEGARVKRCCRNENTVRASPWRWLSENSSVRTAAETSICSNTFSLSDRTPAPPPCHSSINNKSNNHRRAARRRRCKIVLRCRSASRSSWTMRRRLWVR